MSSRLVSWFAHIILKNGLPIMVLQYQRLPWRISHEWLAWQWHLLQCCIVLIKECLPEVDRWHWLLTHDWHVWLQGGALTKWCLRLQWCFDLLLIRIRASSNVWLLIVQCWKTGIKLQIRFGWFAWNMWLCFLDQHRCHRLELVFLGGLGTAHLWGFVVLAAQRCCEFWCLV